MHATLKNYRQSPRKVRLVADSIRGKEVNRALTLLSTGGKRANGFIKKLVESAVANAKTSAGGDKNNLIIKDIQVNEGIVFKRYRPRARGRAAPIRKKTSHISIALEEQSKKSQASNTKPQIKTSKKLKAKN
ncbi:MAG: 50S ribosomal protein L22 [Candidatus Pacebacteria bacterium]|jgi:large subunit ribosomal protein L22|nr:50S ribosomal protein L22 [Candidatus Paceibacterota bacterium]|tara:strand:- start:16370 stop:16765 length:396 start_codon:yes stop_codon:yes gene_type:complete